MSRTGKELCDQGCFTVKGNSLCVTVCCIALIGLENDYFTNALELKSRDCLSSQHCYVFCIIIIRQAEQGWALLNIHHMSKCWNAHHYCACLKFNDLEQIIQLGGRTSLFEYYWN